MTKSRKLVKNSHKNVNLCDKIPQTSVKKAKIVNLGDKKPETRDRKDTKM